MKRQGRLRGAGAVLALAAAMSVGAVAAPAALAVPTNASRFVPFGPTRLVDSRQPNQHAMLGSLGDGAVIPIQVTGEAGLPTTGITAVAVNVTVVNTTSPGYVQAFPTNQAAVGASSNLNIDHPGQVVAAMAVVPVGDGGRISVYTEHRSDVIVDVAGYFTPAASATAGRYVALSPVRYFDSRTGLGPTAVAPFAAGEQRQVQITGRGDVPVSGAAAVVLNLTMTGTAGTGFVAAVPSNGVLPPSTSNVNVQLPGETRANLAIVPLGPDGAIKLYASVSTNVIVDVTGYVTAAAAPMSSVGLFVPVTPARLLDSRVDLGYTGAKPGPGASFAEQVAGRAGVPVSDVAAVAATITATQSTNPGYVTVWPDRQPLPNVSTLNASASDSTVANAALITLGNGAFDLYTQSGAHLIADVSGYFLGTPTPPTQAANDQWAYWGYLYGDGQLRPNGQWVWSQDPYYFTESQARFERGAKLNGVKLEREPTGTYETLTVPHPPVPDMHGRPDSQVAAFMAALVEGEGDACSGLIDDDPSQAHVQYVADLLTQLGVAWRLESSNQGTYWELYAKKASWPIVQSWPYATTARTPGIGTLIC